MSIDVGGASTTCPRVHRPAIFVPRHLAWFEKKTAYDLTGSVVIRTDFSTMKEIDVSCSFLEEWEIETPHVSSSLDSVSQNRDGGDLSPLLSCSRRHVWHRSHYRLG